MRENCTAEAIYSFMKVARSQFSSPPLLCSMQINSALVPHASLLPPLEKFHDLGTGSTDPHFLEDLLSRNTSLNTLILCYPPENLVRLLPTQKFTRLVIQQLEDYSAMNDIISALPKSLKLFGGLRLDLASFQRLPTTLQRLSFVYTTKLDVNEKVTSLCNLKKLTLKEADPPRVNITPFYGLNVESFQ